MIRCGVKIKPIVKYFMLRWELQAKKKGSVVACIQRQNLLCCYSGNRLTDGNEPVKGGSNHVFDVGRVVGVGLLLAALCYYRTYCTGTMSK